MKSFAQRSVGGVAKDGATVGLTHITEATLNEKLDNLNKHNNEFQDSKTALLLEQKNLGEALNAALSFAQVTRDNLKPKFGPQYSKAWDAVGFYNRTLTIPRAVPKAMGLVKSMGLFLEAHPELAIADVMTAAIATAIYDPLNTAYLAVSVAKTDLREKRTARNTARKELRQHLIQLRRELSMLLPADDPRWLTFGFNVPADMSVPNAPEGVTVTPGLPGEGALSWDHTVNAERFHVWQQRVGVDTDPVKIRTVTGTSVELTGLASGAHVKFFVTAVNGSGESIPSAVVELVVP